MKEGELLVAEKTKLFFVDVIILIYTEEQFRAKLIESPLVVRE
jgi:hypothetical protein